MVIKFLGAVDIFTGAIFLIYGIFISLWNIHLFSGVILGILGGLLLAKGLVFALSLYVVSFFDVAFGFVIIFSDSVKIPLFIVAIISLFLVQKGIFSFLD